ncbi:MAG: head GIN domain-containing protein [Bacteroidales bacterium]
MKTTNRILGITLAIFMIAIIAIMIFVRTQLIQHIGHVEGSGEVRTERREIAPFNRVSVAGNLTLHVMQDENRQLEVQADDNLLEFVVTEVEDGKLIVSLDQPVRNNEQLDVYIRIPELEELSVSRGAQAFAENPITGAYLSHTLQAGAKSTLNLQVDSLDIKARAGAIARLAGRADIMNIYSTAGAIIYAGELLVENCEIDASAGSLNYLHVTGMLSGQARYGALVHFEGNPGIEDYKSSHAVEFEGTNDGHSDTHR